VIAVLATSLTILGYFPYLRDILKRKTTPHLYTWLIWAITQGTATAALWYGGGNLGAMGLAAGTILVTVTCLLALKYGTTNITRGDTILLVLALIAILIWWQLHSPLLAVVMVTTVDAIGYLPTLRKSFSEPWSETLSFWATMTAVSLLVILSNAEYNFLTVTYSALLATANSTLWMVCYFRRKTVPNPQLESARNETLGAKP
jgi:hypothetical protein